MNEGGSDYLAAMLPVGALELIAGAKRVAGNALGFQFQLSDAPRRARRAFVAHVLAGKRPQREPRLTDSGSEGGELEWLSG